MMNNPLIERYRYSLLRPRQLWVFLAVYLVVTALILFINASIYAKEMGWHPGYQNAVRDWPKFFRDLFYQFLIVQVVIVWIWGGFNTGAALKEELLQKSYDFFRMLPLSAVDKAVGILVGRNLVVLLLAAANLLFILPFGALGGVSGGLQVQLFLALISVGLAVNVAALMISTHAPAKRARSGGIAGVLFVSFFAVPVLMNVLMVTSKTESLETRCVGFFAANVPVLLLVSFFALYYAAWMFKGVTRVLSREGEPLFSRGGGAGFMLGHIVLMLGLAWPHFTPRDFPAPIYGFWLAGLFPLFFIPLGSVTTFERYFEEAGGAAGAGQQGAGAFLRRSNLSYWLALGGLWAASSLVVGVVSGLGPVLALCEVVVILSFCLVFFLFLELSILYTPIYSKIGVLIAVLIGIVLCLPLYLPGSFGKSNLYMFCLPGFWTELLQDEKNPRLPLFGLVVAYNLALSIAPLWLVLRRYQFIVTARRKM